MPIIKTKIWSIINLIKEINTTAKVSAILLNQEIPEENIEKALISATKNQINKLYEIVNDTVKEQK